MMAEDLAASAARFGAALRAAGVPADPGRCERFARAVAVARPASPRALYLCALATLTSTAEHAETLERVFAAVFGGEADLAGHRGDQHAPPLPGGRPRSSIPPDVLAEAARAARAHATKVLQPEQDAEEGSPDGQHPGQTQPEGEGEPGDA